MRCPNCDFVFHRREGSTAFRILEILELEGSAALTELPALIGATWPTTRRAYHHMLKSGEIRTDSHGNVQLGRTQ